ncbi:GTPase Era [compost metagenome]
MARNKINNKNQSFKLKKGKGILEDKFNVLVLATMSAGKTSFINALIGQDILHTANEATTACITSVEHRDNLKYFCGACYSYNDLELESLNNTTATVIRSWNANAEVKRICLSGSFKIAPRPAPGLVLHDTPGPNNSQNKQHAQLMLEALQQIPVNALFYVLNAGQLATQDDRNLLEQVRDEMTSKPSIPIYFILNKIDLLDPDKGEDVVHYVNLVRHYLASLGFKRPMIIPTMASIALYARKALKTEELTRAQRLKLRQVMDEFKENKRSLLNAARVPTPIKRTVSKALTRLEKQRNDILSDSEQCEINDLKQLVALSGLRTVEALIKNQRK